MGQEKDMVVKFFSFAQYHNKRPVPGSTKIRVENLIKHWPGASMYNYGEDMDVMIFQKVYVTYDYKYINHLNKIKILDVCDPDWTNSPDIYIKETLDNVHAVVVPTKSLQKLIQQMTDKPVRVIKDRFDIAEFPHPKKHKGDLKTLVWFGYAHNAELLRHAMPSLESRGINLICISNEDPAPYRWTQKPDEYIKRYTYIKYKQDTVYKNIQIGDACILPKGYRPQDKYKSENRNTIAQLCGLPIIQSTDDIEKYMTADSRNGHIDTIYDKLKQEYDCKLSVSEYKELIKEIREDSGNHG